MPHAIQPEEPRGSTRGPGKKPEVILLSSFVYDQSGIGLEFYLPISAGYFFNVVGFAVVWFWLEERLHQLKAVNLSGDFSGCFRKSSNFVSVARTNLITGGPKPH